MDGNPRFIDNPFVTDTGNGTPPIVDMGAYEAPGIIYVDAQASGTNDGASWANAFTNLQSALSIANYGDEIWVAAGTYKPSREKPPFILTPMPTATPAPNNRNNRFELKNGVGLYGGFNGTETSRDQRNWQRNITTLSGDLGAEGTTSDNSYHVLECINGDATTILDGFTITGGNASDDYGFRPVGGGIYLEDSSPTLRNIILSNNAARDGGGLYIQDGSPSLFNVVFIGNSAVGGGGLYGDGGGIHLTNVRFSGNTATHDGGGLYIRTSRLRLYNATFSGNAAVKHNGGGLYNEFGWVQLYNATFSGNTAVSGSAIYRDIGTVRVVNGIIWGNTGGSQIAAPRQRPSSYRIQSRSGWLRWRQSGC